MGMIRLTPAMLESAYEWLRTTAPFRAWKLPHADDLVFKVTLHRDRGGHYAPPDDSYAQPEIAISANGTGTYDHLHQVMAHEMIHLYLCNRGQDDDHGPKFQKVAKRVCKYHGFDYDKFIR